MGAELSLSRNVFISIYKRKRYIFIKEINTNDGKVFYQVTCTTRKGACHYKT